MPVILKSMILIAALTGISVGFAMLFFFEKFMAFNDHVNRNFLNCKKYEVNAFGVDQWLFAKSYLTALFLLIVGIILLGTFAVYAPY